MSHFKWSNECLSGLCGEAWSSPPGGAACTFMVRVGGSSVLRVSECRGGGDGTCCVGCDVSRRRVWGDVP